tara:strand:- start:5403 stop:5702 length:300 start_codon:yes stop_codon:yes gene_type:complete
MKDLNIPDGVKHGIEDLAKELAKHHMAGEISISKGSGDDHGDDHKGSGDGMCEELKTTLSSWDDEEHPYYKDVEKIIKKYDDDDDEEYEEEEEEIEEEY